MVTPMETVFLPPITDVAYQNCQQRALPVCLPWSVAGQSSRSDLGLATSGLPQSTAIDAPTRLVRFGPEAEVAAR